MTADNARNNKNIINNIKYITIIRGLVVPVPVFR